jgi:hypothetical protein
VGWPSASAFIFCFYFFFVLFFFCFVLFLFFFAARTTRILQKRRKEREIHPTQCIPSACKGVKPSFEVAAQKSLSKKKTSANKLSRCGQSFCAQPLPRCSFA